MPEGIAGMPWWILPGLVLALIGVLVLIAKVFMWAGGVNANQSSFARSLKRVEERFENDIKRIENNIKELQMDLHNLNMSFAASKTVVSKSPFHLSEVGQKVSTALDVPAMADRLVPVIRPRAKGKLAYDIQELCFNFARSEYEPSPEIDARIKEYAYENALSRYEVLDVLAIELRDRLLALERPGSDVPAS